MSDNTELIATARLRAEKYVNGSEAYMLNRLIAAIEAAEAECDAAARLLDLYAGTIFGALSKPGLEGGYALAVTHLGPYLGARKATK